MMPSRPETASGGEAPRVPLQILVVQDHPLLASAIAFILGSEPDLKVCGIARSGGDAAAVAFRNKADVVLMDFNLPDVTGPSAAAMIRARLPEVAIVFHSAEDSETALLDAIDAGATAYLTKSATADQIVAAVRRAARGEVLIPVELFAKAIERQRITFEKEQDRDRHAAQFTRRELDVLKLLAEGLDTVAIAKKLGIAANTVEWHMRHVIEKLEVRSKLQAVVAAARLGLIEMPKP
jgi:two-component system, NarL family, nitrate/nitrite response regulator NarL